MPSSVGASPVNPSAFVRFFVLVIICLAFSVSAYAQTLIVAIGASNVAGRGVWLSQAWPAQLERMLNAKGYDVRIKNSGKNGDTTSGMLHRLFFAVPSGTKIVILDVGGGYYNNRKTTIASQARGPQDIKAIETKLKSRGIIVIVVRTIGGDLPLTLKQPDKIHLTPEGHKLVAERLMPRVIDALKSSGG